MGEKILQANDTVRGSQGVVQAIIDNKVETLLHVKKVEAKLEKNKEALAIAGSMWEHSKTKNMKGTGNMTVYYMSPLFRKIAKKLKKGMDVELTLIVTNDDENSSVGRQSMALYGVNLDSIPLALFDVDSAALEESVDFTFTDFEELEAFKKPSYFK